MILFDRLPDGSYVKNFDVLIESIPYVFYSSSVIELPGILAYASRKPNVRWLLSPNLAKIIDVSQEDMDEMLGILQENGLSIKSGVAGYSQHWLNLEKIAKDMVFFEEKGHSVTVNDMLFTTDKLEYHGAFLARSKFPFLLSENEMKEVKEFLKKRLL